VLAIQTVMPVGYAILLLSAKTKQENQRNEASRLRKCTVKWGNIVFGFNIVTSLPKFLTGHSSLSNEFVGLM
jgi:hypothetical protein